MTCYMQGVTIKTSNLQSISIITLCTEVGDEAEEVEDGLVVDKSDSFGVDKSFPLPLSDGCFVCNSLEPVVIILHTSTESLFIQD